MQATLVNNWWMTTDTGGSMGTTNTSGITSKQIHNATLIYRWFKSNGFSDSAIAGMIGNMQVESWLSPALIQATHRSQLPNHAANLSDVPNSVMINYYDRQGSGYGVGLVQWDGYTPLDPPGQKMVSYAINNNWNWYDGLTQMNRIIYERDNNYQWTSYRINGIQWYWSNFPTNTQTPEVSAHIWQACYEVADPQTLPTREANARYWYDYFIAHPSAGLIPVWLISQKRRLLKNVKR